MPTQASRLKCLRLSSSIRSSIPKDLGAAPTVGHFRLYESQGLQWMLKIYREVTPAVSCSQTVEPESESIRRRSASQVCLRLAMRTIHTTNLLNWSVHRDVRAGGAACSKVYDE